MSLEHKKQQVINSLIELSVKKGFVTIEEILNCLNNVNLPLDEVDRLCESLISRGVIIREGSDYAEIQVNDDGEYQYDKSRIDYDSLFDKVIKLDPSLADYVNEIRLIPPPQHREEISLIYHAKDGNTYARERIITMYLKVALRIALWNYDRYALPLAETIQDANMGLVKALDKMPLNPENRFSTYAPWWMRQYIYRATQGISKKYYLPVHLKDKIYAVIEIKNNHDCDLCLNVRFCPGLIEEICQRLSVNHETAESYLDIIEEPINIDENLESEEDALMYSDNGAIEARWLKDAIKETLATLPYKERRVIELRFGINDGVEKNAGRSWASF